MKTVIEMALEAGDDWDSTLSTDKEFLARFAEIVRADEREQGQKWFDAVTAQHKQAILAEREACAQVVWGMKGTCWAYDHDTIAAAIRARSNT